ncbi:MAG: radical SAM protein [Deltaproteobacteria bacterium]|nr:MAG: radical SAM protein [Deltaproteobacteria bacterium]
MRQPVLEPPVYRPPSEANSLILQATRGCSHNECAFCVAYQQVRFRARPLGQVLEEIDWVGANMSGVRRAFLADGDAFVLSSSRLLPILERLYEKLPALERVSIYASPQNIAAKSDAELKRLRRAGLGLLYFGLESGDDDVLRRIRKGATARQMIDQCIRAQEAGFDLSVTVILGLAGPKGSRRHAEATARALDAICPRWASALTLMLAPRKPSYQRVYGEPDWRPLSPWEALRECRWLIENMNADGITFRSNHASNYLALKGQLSADKKRLLETIDRVLEDPDSPLLRPEWLRAL